MARPETWQFSRQDSRAVHYDREFQDSTPLKTKRPAVDAASRSNFPLLNPEKLPASSSVRTATVGTSAPMEAARAASGTPVAAEAVPAISSKAALVATAFVEAPSAAIEARTSVKTSSFEITSITTSIVTTTVVAATIVSASAVEAMEPWASADKDAAYKVVWSVVAVRRTSIRRIPVVAIFADGRCITVPWADSYSNNHSLCVRRECGRKHTNCQ